MLIHVTIRYAEAENPTEEPDRLRGLVAFGEWMEAQTEFPDVTPLHVYWSAEKPPTGYAVFEAPTAEALRAYMTRMPRPATLDLHPVRELSQSLEEGRERVAEMVGSADR